MTRWPAKQSVPRSQLIIASSAVARMAITLVVTILLGRILRPADFGFFSLIVTLFAVARELMELGTGNLAIREIALHPAREQSILDTLMGLRGLIGFALGFAVLLVAAMQEHAQQAQVLVGAAAVMPFLAVGALATVYQVRQDQGPPAVIVLTLQLAFLALCLLLHLAGAPAWTFAALVVAREVAGIVWFVGLTKRRLGYFVRPSWDFRAIARFAREASTFGAAAALYQICFFIGPLLVWFMRSPAEMGAYSAAFRPISPLLTLPWLLTLPLLPVLTRLAANNRPAFEEQASYLIPLSVGLGVIGAILGSGLSHDAIQLLYGGRYLAGPLSAVNTLALLSLSFTFSIITAVITTFLLADGRERILLRITLIGLAVNLACNFLFLPIYGFQAAAMATVATEVCIFSMGLILIARASILTHVQPCAGSVLVPAVLLFLALRALPETLGVQRLLPAFLMACASIFALLMLPTAREGRRRLSAHNAVGESEK
jgi:O-antigen/teichoic acid export membrane protein